VTLRGAATATDVAASEWAIDDFVIRLREWGTDTIRVLPAGKMNWNEAGLTSARGVFSAKFCVTTASSTLRLTAADAVV